ncbi:MAG: ABC transporter substrate-binding protein [Tagaea sp.]|nr:ABC transporter substrate-binding protein [Tagaea sp.]
MGGLSKREALKLGGAAALAAGLGAPAIGQAQAVEITLWSHWAAEQIKRDFVEDAVRRFEATNPGVRIRTAWYEKTALYAALRTALRANTAPDIFYAEPDQTEYMDNGLLLDLSALNWANVEAWAKNAWTWRGKPYGLPLEASTVELYYNRAMLAELGMALPAAGQFSAEQFMDMVRRARARNWTPMALGVGDRPFPGAYLTHEALLKRLGVADYGALMAGGLPFNDSRVVETLRWLKGVIDAGLLPTSFTSLKLGEAHTFFHTNPRAVTFLNGSWYTSRAFNPVDKGGQPADFPLGIMNYPAIPGAAAPEAKTMAVGGSYVVNAATRQPQRAVAFLNSLATPEMGNRWLENVLVQTGIKSDPSRIGGPYAGYFKMLADVNARSVYYFGLPSQVMQGRRRETFTQVFNNAFPAGTIGVDDAVRQMMTAAG